jgi:hypothetical protein
VELHFYMYLYGFMMPFCTMLVTYGIETGKKG